MKSYNHFTQMDICCLFYLLNQVREEGIERHKKMKENSNSSHSHSSENNSNSSMDMGKDNSSEESHE